MFPLACLNSLEVWIWARLFIQSAFLIGLLVRNNWYLTDTLLKYRCVWNCSDTSRWSLIEIFTLIQQYRPFFFQCWIMKKKGFLVYLINTSLCQKWMKLLLLFEIYLWTFFMYKESHCFPLDLQKLYECFWSMKLEWGLFLARKLGDIFSWNALPLKTDHLLILISLFFLVV